MAPVEVARFISVHQAEFVRSVLEGSGIEAFLDQPFTGSIAPHLMFGSGGVRVFVAEEDRARAVEVLQSLDQQRDDESSDGEPS
ncbi:MAG TPA: DUF2007 domain-containing protein [Vicinamibacterales bacterium]|nr:DUF2007 domain-containing protein [Vicinamibacterales bacterium]